MFAAAVDDAVIIRDDAILVVGVDAGHPCFDGRLHFATLRAERDLKPLVPPEFVGLQIPVPDGTVCGFGQQAKTLFTLAAPLPPACVPYGIAARETE